MIAAFSIWLTITAGGVDMGGHVVFHAPVLSMTAGQYTGFSIPHVGIADPGWASSVPHELSHQRQFDALGPAQPLAYTLTLGRPFEDYQGDMWEPSPELERQCPVVRYDFDAREMTFMPCWQGVLEWR